MENKTPGRLNDSFKHWYLFLILGCIFLLLGIWIFLTPVAAYLTLAIFFAVSFLITGILEISYALSNRGTSHTWGWSLAGGIFDLLIGLLLVLQPRISMLVLPYYIGFGILLRSLLGIAWSLFLKGRQVKGWGNLMVIGILGVLFAFIALWNPLFAGFTIVFYTGIAFLMVGIFYVYLSLKLRKL